MLRIFDLLHRVTTRRPRSTMAGVVVVSVLLGWLASQAINDDAIAVDNEPARALATLDATFADRQSVVQIVVTTDGQSVVSQAGMATSRGIEEAIRSSEVATTLVDAAVGGETNGGPGAAGPDGPPAIASFLGGVDVLAQMQGRDPASLGDDDVVALFVESANVLPGEVSGLFSALVEDAQPPTRALMLVFQSTEGLDDAAVADQQRALAEVVQSVELPAGFTAEAFSFGLLLTAGDVGPEIGRLFGTALVIILVVLALVYWLRPAGQPRARIVRRTAADVGLTLAVIVLAVVWMQGIGVALGPGYLDVIGAFSPQTQIVPILIIGLGVDFAIHLLARYRTETASSDPVVGFKVAARTTGPTLLLCTAATAIGFLTNLASPVDFLATLGVLAAAGIIAAFVLTMTLLPAARVMLDRRAQRRGTLPSPALASSTSRALPRMIGRTAWLAERAPVMTVVVALVVVTAGAYGFSQLDTEFELTDFVPQDEPLLDTFATLQQAFGGGFEETTQVLLVGEVDRAREEGAIDEFIASIASIAGVERFGDRADATLTVTDDGTVGRIEVRTSAGQGGASQLEQDLTAAAAGLDTVGVTATVASQQIVQARIGDDIEDSQIASLLIALAAAMALLAVHYGVTVRRPGLGVVTVLPVVLVLAATFGTMALTGIPLNAVTATLAALSIGIGVPFTIHVTGRFMEEIAVDGDRSAAVRRTVTATGGALAGSALTTAIGFGILTTSTLKPFEQLGYVIVYAIAYSFVAAVLVLPSMLVLWHRRQRAA